MAAPCSAFRSLTHEPAPGGPALVTVEAPRHGDGWLSVDTAAWIAARAEYAEDLTEDLRGWLEEHGHRYPHTDAVTQWATERSGVEPTGLYGDGPAWAHNTVNVESLLSDDIGFVVRHSGDLGELMITQSGDGGIYGDPEVYRSTVDDTAEWADYSRAYGRCGSGHEWMTEDAYRLHSDGAQLPAGTPTISGQARVPFGDPSRAYIACPDCGRALRFSV